MSNRGKPGELRGIILPSLERIRVEKGLSRRALADNAGVDYATLWRLETRKSGASPFTIRQIAESLEVSEADLRESAGVA